MTEYIWTEEDLKMGFCYIWSRRFSKRTTSMQLKALLIETTCSMKSMKNFMKNLLRNGEVSYD